MYTEYMYKDSLAHFGIKGQRWGVRRYQYEDGTLTPEGRMHYGVKEGDSDYVKTIKTDIADLSNDNFKKKYNNVEKSVYMKYIDNLQKINPNNSRRAQRKIAKSDKKFRKEATTNNIKELKRSYVNTVDKIKKAYKNGEINKATYHYALVKANQLYEDSLKETKDFIKNG